MQVKIYKGKSFVRPQIIFIPIRVLLHFGPEINHRDSTFPSHTNACSSILTGSFICPFRKTLWIFYIRISAKDLQKFTQSIEFNLYCIVSLFKSYKRRKSNKSSDNMRHKGPIKQYLQRASSSIGGGVMRRTRVVGHRFCISKENLQYLILSFIQEGQNRNKYIDLI